MSSAFARQRGQSAVEVVLLAPFLLVLVFLIFEFGNVFLRWVSITNAAREGARFAITQAWSQHSCGGSGGGTCTQTDDSIRRRVCQTAASGRLLFTANCTDEGSSQWRWCRVEDNLPPTGYSSCVIVSWERSTFTTPALNMVTVTAVHQVQTLFPPISADIPYVGSINYPGSMTVKSLTSMRTLE